jgi:hypothetical protein
MIYNNVNRKNRKHKKEKIKMENKNDNEILENQDGNDGAEIIDLDGEPFAVIGELEHEGVIYVALIPYKEPQEDDDDEELEFVILKEVEEDGEFFLGTIEDDDFYEKIGEMFLKMFAESGEMTVDS